MTGVNLCSNMKTWQADIPWQWEWQPSRYIVCNKRGMGKGGKREGDSELKLRRSWDISPQDILRQSTKIHKLSVSVPVSSVNAAVHRSKLHAAFF